MEKNEAKFELLGTGKSYKNYSTASRICRRMVIGCGYDAQIVIAKNGYTVAIARSFTRGDGLRGSSVVRDRYPVPVR